jgi:hypothetical protein
MMDGASVFLSLGAEEHDIRYRSLGEKGKNWTTSPASSSILREPPVMMGQIFTTPPLDMDTACWSFRGKNNRIEYTIMTLYLPATRPPYIGNVGAIQQLDGRV